MPRFRSNLDKNDQPLCKIMVYPFFIRQPKEGAQKYHACLALIDTGANRSCITDKLAKELKLSPISVESVNNTTGIHTTNVYRINILVASYNVNHQQKEDLSVKNFLGVNVMEIKHMDNNKFQCILGMDIIKQGHLTFFDNSYVFSL